MTTFKEWLEEAKLPPIDKKKPSDLPDKEAKKLWDEYIDFVKHQSHRDLTKKDIDKLRKDFNRTPVALIKRKIYGK